MRWGSIILFVALCSFTAYYIYEPIPEEIEQRWKLMLTDCVFRTLNHIAELSDFLELKDYMGVMYAVTLAEAIQLVSDERVAVKQENFDGVEVALYQPQQQAGDAELRRAVIFIHGGGWCLGSIRMKPYDLVVRKMVTELDAVVLSVEYRLAPKHHFPVPYEDVYRVVKHFLQEGVLAQYSVDPERIAVSGDSAGGNLAAVISQQIQKEPDQQIKLKAQALIYPVTQVVDLNTPSYQQNRYMPILPRTLMLRFWSQYFTEDKALFWAMMANTHNNPESAGLLKYANWSAFLPEAYRRKYQYSVPAVVPAVGKDGPTLSLADPRASPLQVPDASLRSLPKAYVVTCEYDVLRDDGIMYVTRLRAAGVEVTHEHYRRGFHGALMFNVWPTNFQIADRMSDRYLKWLKENL